MRSLQDLRTGSSLQDGKSVDTPFSTLPVPNRQTKAPIPTKPISPEPSLIERQDIRLVSFLSDKNKTGIGEIHGPVRIFFHQVRDAAELLDPKNIDHGHACAFNKLDQTLPAISGMTKEGRCFRQDRPTGNEHASKGRKNCFGSIMRRIARIEKSDQRPRVEQPCFHFQQLFRSISAAQLPRAIFLRSIRTDPARCRTRSKSNPRFISRSISSRRRADSVFFSERARRRNASRCAFGSRIVSVVSIRRIQRLVRRNARHGGSDCCLTKNEELCHPERSEGPHGCALCVTSNARQESPARSFAFAQDDKLGEPSPGYGRSAGSRWCQWVLCS